MYRSALFTPSLTFHFYYSIGVNCNSNLPVNENDMSLKILKYYEMTAIFTERPYCDGLFYHVLFNLKGHNQAEIIKNRWFYFGLLIWPYDVNMSID